MWHRRLGLILRPILQEQLQRLQKLCRFCSIKSDIHRAVGRLYGHDCYFLVIA